MPRNLLVAVDRTQAAEKCVDFALKNIWREGDVVHLLHVVALGQDNVIPMGLDSDLMVGVGSTLPNEDKQRAIDAEAKQFLLAKFVPSLEAAKVAYSIEVARCSQDNDSIGAAICKRADELDAVAVVIAKHDKGAIAELFVGSVTKYCTHNCKKPLVVMHVG